MVNLDTFWSLYVLSGTSEYSLKLVIANGYSLVLSNTNGFPLARSGTTRKYLLKIPHTGDIEHLDRCGY